MSRALFTLLLFICSIALDVLALTMRLQTPIMVTVDPCIPYSEGTFCLRGTCARKRVCSPGLKLDPVERICCRRSPRRRDPSLSDLRREPSEHLGRHYHVDTGF
ncbi:hypothetical protein B0H16DRAFT_345108 [Mycena metata]|uniref:Uncharacterized protein n=1 Tax=Mycena metata TaxID=1033252 RepID=A0AAD7MLN7_9AGAR|nr:hypothetical protein B0H16DRAFT_345108 [Mycena metata]